jgi:hypothetical protein
MGPQGVACSNPERGGYACCDCCLDELGHCSGSCPVSGGR